MVNSLNQTLCEAWNALIDRFGINHMQLELALQIVAFISKAKEYSFYKLGPNLTITSVMFTLLGATNT
jgi:hypothetical protein